MNRVFADAFYFVALLNRADQYHGRATALARELREDILTSEWVLAEVADAMAGSVNRLAVAAFIRDLSSDPKVTIVRASSDWFERGLQLYEQRPDKDWTLTDCISFAIMTEEKLSCALTGDHHFAQAGFTALLE